MRKKDKELKKKIKPTFGLRAGITFIDETLPRDFYPDRRHKDHIIATCEALEALRDITDLDDGATYVNPTFTAISEAKKSFGLVI